MLTQQYNPAHCRYEYTADRKYFRTYGLLRVIPRFIPADAVEVDLHGNRITRIESYTFSRLTQCTNLDLSSNRISEVQAEAFYGLTSLTRLSLKRNRITQLGMEPELLTE